ncbi:MAG: hypothetical protein LM590_03455 [Thermofilum sp.]|jgi:hypothetical protein|nr:hypothetical protein [Thermofilum sp.]
MHSKTTVPCSIRFDKNTGQISLEFQQSVEGAMHVVVEGEPGSVPRRIVFPSYKELLSRIISETVLK